MARLAVVVEDSFLVPALGGIVFTPNVAEEVEPGHYDARLVLADGSSSETTVLIDWVHFSPTGYQRVCRAPGLTKVQAPAGTEIWIDEFPRPKAGETS